MIHHGKYINTEKTLDLSQNDILKLLKMWRLLRDKHTDTDDTYKLWGIDSTLCPLNYALPFDDVALDEKDELYNDTYGDLWKKFKLRLLAKPCKTLRDLRRVYLRHTLVCMMVRKDCDLAVALEEGSPLYFWFLRQAEESLARNLIYWSMF